MPIKEILIKNTIFREKPEKPQFNPSYEAPKGSLLERLHSSRNLIQEKAFGKISAFDFNRDVFNGGHWNDPYEVLLEKLNSTRHDAVEKSLA